MLTRPWAVGFRRPRKLLRYRARPRADRIVADVALGHLFVPPGEEKAPGGLWQDRDEERPDIPAAQQLRPKLRPGPRCPDASTNPAGKVAKVRAGNARVADDPAGRPGVLHGGPALDRTPVMPHKMDGPDAHLGQNGEGIVHEGLQRKVTVRALDKLRAPAFRVS